MILRTMRADDATPAILQATVEATARLRFRELLERDPGSTPLEEAVGRVLDSLAPHNDPAGHRRLVAMALAMAKACLPTLLAYQPEDRRPGHALEAVSAWLDDPQRAVPDPEELFPWRPTGAQAWNEAQDVYHQLLRSTQPGQAREAVLTLLDDCFEGYAVQIGADPHRRLFDWWLEHVVPAAVMGEVPPHSYRPLLT